MEPRAYPLDGLGRPYLPNSRLNFLVPWNFPNLAALQRRHICIARNRAWTPGRRKYGDGKKSLSLRAVNEVPTMRCVGVQEGAPGQGHSIDTHDIP
jgi:hypothetical protein